MTTRSFSRFALSVLRRFEPFELMCTLTQFYKEFLESNKVLLVNGEEMPVKVGQTMFCTLKPRWVKKEVDRNVCCCKYHVELMFMVQTLNEIRSSHGGKYFALGVGCTCTSKDCVVCRFLMPLGGSGESPESSTNGEQSPDCEAACNSITSLRHLVSQFLCQSLFFPAEGNETEMWYRKDCINLSCPSCGPKKFTCLLCPVYKSGTPSEGELNLKWKRYEYVEQGFKDSNGHEKKRLELVHVVTPVSTFIGYLGEKLAHFAKHDFTQKWQAKQYRRCIKSFPLGTVVSVIDFAENYTFVPQNEIQSEYWTSKQVTILVHIFYYHSPSSTREFREVEKVVHFYISDDRKHDSFFVQHAFGLHKTWMEQQGIHFEQHWVWSDGAPTQFKNSTNLFFVSKYPSTNKESGMMWNFFCSGHGKGEHDGQGAVLKSRLRQHQLSPATTSRRFDRAEDVVSFCRRSFQRGVKEGVTRVFWDVKEEDVERSTSLQPHTLLGCKKLHCFWGNSRSDTTLLATREFTYMCENCLEGKEELCSWQEWTMEWFFKNLSISHVPEVEEPVCDGFNVGNDHEVLSNSVILDDVFAVKADNDDVEYYLLRCTGVKQTIRDRELTCSWNKEHVFTRDEVVLYGTYFMFQKFLKEKVVFVETKYRDDAIIYSHLVRAVKINLSHMQATGKKKSSPRFFIDYETHEQILSAVSEGQAPEA